VQKKMHLLFRKSCARDYCSQRRCR